MSPPCPRSRRGSRPSGSSAAIQAALLLLLAGGCKSPEAYREDADEEVYALIQARRSELLDDTASFTIEPAADSLRQRALRGEVAVLEQLSLADCLEIAAENSREYQAQKERLYLVALDVTLERWRFQTQFGGVLAATLSGDGEGAQRAQADGDVTLSRLLGTGADIVASLGTSLFRVVSTGDGWDALSDVGLSFSQPLLRGAGRAIVEEPLTQAQRDLVYAVRDFERFRRSFAVDVANRFYRVLQAMDNVANEKANAQSLEELRQRNEAYAQSGRLSDIQLDQAKQQELSSRNRLIQLEENLESQLDDFKLFLGLPIEVRLSLDEAEKERPKGDLAEAQELLGKLDEQALTSAALGSRLDYLTVADEVHDAERQVKIAADGLRAGLDFEGAIGASTPEGQPFSFRSQNVDWSLGLRLDLPVDQLPERNAYRRSLISFEASLREQERLADTIRADLRNQLRLTSSTRQSYELQLIEVELAQRRVRSASLNLDAGRADTRDVLDAQADLLSAQNALTRALTDFALARLQLYLDMELLYVDESGISVDNAALVQLVEESP